METRKEKPWHERVLEIKPGRTKYFDWSKRRSVRGAISDKILNDYPDAEFTTKKVVVQSELKLLVERVR